MLEGLVQHDHPLTLQHVLGRMRNVYGASEVVTLTDNGTERATYAEVTARVDKLAGALTDKLGVEPGDRVATFAWNTQRHLEVYLAAPCIRRRAAHAQPAPVRGAAHLHREPREGQ